ncbi:MAG: DUF2723 domain-containing protein [Anaerolineales bacterium]|nr:DUF2723 domain-containing protein [Anaerolineales bacterium]
MNRSFSLVRSAPPVLLGVVLFSIYITTMAPGLTWANDGSDGGDLITAAAIGGVPHPTGYPVYLILARTFQAIPVGSLAYRTNLLSAMCMTLASIVLYALVAQYLAAQGRQWPQFAGLVAGLSFGLAPLIWSQAVITEVYALHALLMAVLLFLYTQSKNMRHIYRWRGLFLGLSLGNHVTSIFLIPIFVADIVLDQSTSTRQKWTVFLNQSLWVFVSLTVYLVLPFRASSFPPVNWGNPQTFDGLIWLVTGQLYWDQLLIPVSSFIHRIAAWTSLLLENFSLPGICLGLMGVVYFFQRSRFYVCTLWIAITFSLFSLQYDTVDSKMYLIPAFLCFAAWVGVGMDGILGLVDRRLIVKVVLGTVVISFMFINAIHVAPKVDASNDKRADQFVEMVFAQAPSQAILFVKGDGAVFSLWYYHYALHERPDLFVVASDLLHFPWYLETLRVTYPVLNLTEPFPWPQTIIEMNLGLPYCYVDTANTMEIDCVHP